MKNYLIFMAIFFPVSFMLTGCKEKDTNVEKVEITMCGSYYGNYDLNPYISSNKLISQQILLHISKDYKTINEIAGELDVAPVYIHDEIKHLLKADLVKEQDGRFITNGIIISNNDKKLIKPLSETIAKEISAIITDELDSLQLAYSKSSFQSQGFNWEQMKNLFIYTQLLDLNLIDRGFTLKNVAAGDPPVHENLGEWFLHGIEGKSIEKYALTHNICPSDSGGCAILYCEWENSSQLPPKISFSDNDLKILTILYSSRKSLDELTRQSGLNSDLIEEKIKEMSDLGIIEKVDSYFKVIIPVYSISDSRIMLNEFDRISEKIINNSCKPNLDKIDDLFHACGFDKNKEQYPAFEREVFVTIVNIATQNLIENNILKSPPTQSPWLAWGWTGNILWDE